MRLHLKQFGVAEKDGYAVIDLSALPSPAIMGGGIGGVGHGQYWIEDEMSDRVQLDTTKPPYRVPSMQDISCIEWNGLKVVSTFSGAGGSCTGYRMAGYKVVWANEFIPAAQETYKANAAPDCALDKRDIRKILPETILARCNLVIGGLDLFDGSPPCSSFSTAGKRERGWGQSHDYSDGISQRTDDLFPEYTRILRGLMPKVFVAENVSGLIKGKAKGYFLEILRDLKQSGYKVQCRVLDAQWLGVPQQRQRTIFVGVRDDLPYEPVHPTPLPYRYSVRDALPHVLSLKNDSMGLEGVQNGAFPNRYTSTELPSPPVMAGRTTEMRDDTERRKFTIAELKRICSFPDDFILTGSYAQQWERLGRSVPPVMMCAIASKIRDEILLPCAE